MIFAECCDFCFWHFSSIRSISAKKSFPLPCKYFLVVRGGEKWMFFRWLTSIGQALFSLGPPQLCSTLPCQFAKRPRAQFFRLSASSLDLSGTGLQSFPSMQIFPLFWQKSIKCHANESVFQRTLHMLMSESRFCPFILAFEGERRPLKALFFPLLRKRHSKLGPWARLV